VVGRAMIRGEPAIGRDQSREPRLYSVEPVWNRSDATFVDFLRMLDEMAASTFS
jgi:hypothetical protein